MPPPLAHARRAAKGIARAVGTARGRVARGRRHRGARGGRGGAHGRAGLPAVVANEALGARAHGRRRIGRRRPREGGREGGGAATAYAEPPAQARPAIVRTAYWLRAVRAAPTAGAFAGAADAPAVRRALVRASLYLARQTGPACEAVAVAVHAATVVVAALHAARDIAACARPAGLAHARAALAPPVPPAAARTADH